MPEGTPEISSPQVSQIEKTPRELAKNYDVLSPREFHDDFLAEVSGARKRILVQEMDMDVKGENMDQVVGKMGEAARKRFVPVRVNIDINSLRREPDLPTILQRAGIDTKVVYPGGTQGMKERVLRHNHMKIIVVDDVAYLGGLPLTENVFQYPVEDFMVKLTNPEVVEKLSQIVEHIHSGGTIDNDFIMRTSNGDTILVKASETPALF